MAENRYFHIKRALFKQCVFAKKFEFWKPVKKF